MGAVSLVERLRRPGPKRILALDGGGLRGIVSLGFLERIEALLRERSGRPDLRLSDYFDLIGGTSTGAIIAGGLAIGMSVTEIKRCYLDLGRVIFQKKRFKVWEALFSAGNLETQLRRYFNDHPLDHESIRTGLCIMTKRADTNSLWPLLNHPDGRYFESNRRILLRNAIQASAAAPLFFSPIEVDVGAGETGTFVDGGISTANNPALNLFLVATLKGFPFRWSTGERNLLLVSVGTGVFQWRIDAKAMAKHKAWDWLGHLPRMMIQDAGVQSEIILQFLSRSPTNWQIDSEIGDLSDDLLTPDPLLFYLRYNARLDPDVLDELGLGHLKPKLSRLRGISNPDVIDDLAAIGEAEAKRRVQAGHFPAAFDLGTPS